MPQVSVIMPAYNVARTISEAMDSVLAQSFVDWELIVCDDASRDETVASVSRYLSDSRVRLIQSAETRGGACRARNLALARATGEWVAFLDADDLWLPHKLEMQMDYLRSHPGLVLVHSNYHILYGGRLYRRRYLPTRRVEVEGYLFGRLIWKNGIGTLTVLLDRKVLDRVGLFDESLTMGEDHDLWIRISQHGPFGYIFEPLAIYRSHTTGMFKSVDNLNRTEASLLQISDRYTQGNPVARNKSLARVYGIMGDLYLQNQNRPVACEKLKLALHYAGFEPYALLLLKLLLQASVPTKRK